MRVLLVAFVFFLVHIAAVPLATPPSVVLPLQRSTHYVNPKSFSFPAKQPLKSLLNPRPVFPEVPKPNHDVAVSKVRDDPIDGNIFPVAIFWTEIEVGTPPVSFPVAIDSGSFTTDIPFYQCDTCIKVAPNAAYNPGSSNTSSPQSCNDNCFTGCTNNVCSFSNTYQTCDLSDPDAPCTIDGLLYNDNMSIGPIGPLNFGFGAITYQTSNFDQFKYIDGVMGMAGGSSDGCLFAAMVDAGIISQNVWGVCIHEGKTSNGTLTIGGIDSRLYSGNIQYVPNAGEFGQYGLNLDSISIFGQAASGSNTNAILDSGTNILLVPDQVYQSIRSIFESNCTADPLPGVCNVASNMSLFDGKCYNLTDAQVNAFPNVVINLTGGVPLTMRPPDYLIREHTKNFICMGIVNTGDGGFLIIGDTTMEEYYTIFDVTNNQIGFAPVNTNTCGSL